MTPWTETRTAELLNLWSAGWSTNKISYHFGLNRGSVVGKLNRMGLLGTIRPRVRKREVRRKAVVKTENGSWDHKVFESYENRKIRLAHERGIARGS